MLTLRTFSRFLVQRKQLSVRTTLRLFMDEQFSENGGPFYRKHFGLHVWVHENDGSFVVVIYNGCFLSVFQTFYPHEDK